MKKVFSTMVLVFVLFTSGCGNRNGSGGIMRTSSFMQHQSIESNKQQESKSPATHEAPSATTSTDSIKTVAAAICSMSDFSFGQDIGQDFDSRIIYIELIFVLGAEADYFYNSLRKISKNPVASLFDEQDEYENAKDVAHGLALEKTGCVLKGVNRIACSILEAKEVARDVNVNPLNAIRNRDEQARDIAKVQIDVQAALQNLEEAKAYLNSGNSEYQRVQSVLNAVDTTLNTTGHGDRAQNISMVNRVIKSRNHDLRIDVEGISNDIDNALRMANINNGIDRLDGIINNQDLKDFAAKLRKFEQLLE
jgi:hypothetical protein